MREQIQYPPTQALPKVGAGTFLSPGLTETHTRRLSSTRSPLPVSLFPRASLPAQPCAWVASPKERARCFLPLRHRVMTLVGTTRGRCPASPGNNDALVPTSPCPQAQRMLKGVVFSEHLPSPVSSSGCPGKSLHLWQSHQGSRQGCPTALSLVFGMVTILGERGRRRSPHGELNMRSNACCVALL